MSNHFHVAVRPPERIRITDKELLAKLVEFYGAKSLQVTEFMAVMSSASKLRHRLRNKYLRRMGDLSVFMKEIKEGFTRFYNRLHSRRGTLWDSRFKCTVFADTPREMSTLLAYLDLNAVKAGLVDHPKDYAYSGYGAAEAGDLEAQEGLRSGLGEENWSATRRLLLEIFESQAGCGVGNGRSIPSPEEIEALRRRGERLPLGQLLRLDWRHFLDGILIGSQGYVEGMWRKHLRHCMPKRLRGARRMPGKGWEGTYTLRNPRKDMVRVRVRETP